MIPIVSLVLLVCGVASNAHLEDSKSNSLWNDFKSTHKKSYRTINEELKRKVIFEDNLRFVIDFNSNNATELGFKLAINHLADWTEEEYRNELLGSSQNFQRDSEQFSEIHRVKSVQDLPSSVDWTTKGFVTPVKDQKHCGSCWAFSTTGSLEGQVYKKTGRLVSLSEQNLVDCSESNHGCYGGNMIRAFGDIKKNGGIEAEADYPYVGHRMKCHFEKGKVVATVRSYAEVKEGDEHSLQDAVANIGPISVAMDASSREFRFYHSGIFDPKACSQSRLNHALLAVGYGTENGKDFWLIKNSWGTRWGAQGYLKLVRNRSNRCGIASFANYPLV